MKRIYIIFTLLLMLAASSAQAFDRKIKVEKPDLEKIKTETTNPKSKLYYPVLLNKFLGNDTTMTIEEYRYFYYGTLFQEDYDPYRGPYDSERFAIVSPLYNKAVHKTNERTEIMRYAQASLRDNPVDILQIKNLVYVYEKDGKVNLAKIWRSKLNHLLYVIFSSGTGLDAENAWLVVYPHQEFDIFNIYGIAVKSNNYELPHYDHFIVEKPIEGSDSFYFDLGPVLQQYYMKHPSELGTVTPEDTEATEETTETENINENE